MGISRGRWACSFLASRLSLEKQTGPLPALRQSHACVLHFEIASIHQMQPCLGPPLSNKKDSTDIYKSACKPMNEWN